jgi:alpha-ketoglutarate-dependent 2,4-dichlorophenoxyacetate dioxygenase
MTLAFKKLHPLFAAEASPIDLRTVNDPGTLGEIRAAMDAHAVVVFRDQHLNAEEQLGFSARFDGKLHSQTSQSVLAKNRLGSEALSDVANVNEKGEIMAADDRRRMGSVSNRLWHTDASFVDPPGRYSMLLAKVVPPVRADTEFADMRAAYDLLDDEMKATIAALRVHHSIVYSRLIMGFEFSPAEQARLRGAEHPLVRKIPGSGRSSLYLASHASHIVGWPLPEGRLLLRDLTEHATQRRFVYQHEWRLDDFVLWDNRATMHRARPFDDRKHRRELRRTTTLDLPLAGGT